MRISNARYTVASPESQMPRRGHTAAPKRATTVSVPACFPHAARTAEVSPLAALDELTAAKRKQWLEENKDAIRAYNEHVGNCGTFSDGLRKF